MCCIKMGSRSDESLDNLKWKFVLGTKELLLLNWLRRAVVSVNLQPEAATGEQLERLHTMLIFWEIIITSSSGRRHRSTSATRARATTAAAGRAQGPGSRWTASWRGSGNAGLWLADDDDTELWLVAGTCPDRRGRTPQPDIMTPTPRPCPCDPWHLRRHRPGHTDTWGRCSCYLGATCLWGRGL